jgi:hypothetical protein
LKICGQCCSHPGDVSTTYCPTVHSQI